MRTHHWQQSHAALNPRPLSPTAHASQKGAAETRAERRGNRGTACAAHQALSLQFVAAHASKQADGSGRPTNSRGSWGGIKRTAELRAPLCTRRTLQLICDARQKRLSNAAPATAQRQLSGRGCHGSCQTNATWTARTVWGTDHLHAQSTYSLRHAQQQTGFCRARGAAAGLGKTGAFIYGVTH
jgi:hypothetical protein